MQVDAPDAPVTEIAPSAADDLSPVEGEVIAPSAASDDNPDETPPAAPAKPVLSKEERDARAQAGRERAQARADQKAVQAQMAALTTQVQTLVSGMSAQAQANRDAYIESLAPTDQVAYLRQELAMAKAAPAPAAPVQPQGQTREEIYAAAIAHVGQLNDDLGLTGTKYEIKGDEAAIAKDKGPAGWYASVEALAHTRAERLEEEQGVANKAGQAATAADIAAIVRQEVQKATGAGRSNSSAPAGGGNADITSRQLKELASSGSALKGWRGMREQLEKHRDAYVKKHPVEEMAARSRESSSY